MEAQMKKLQSIEGHFPIFPHTFGKVFDADPDQFIYVTEELIRNIDDADLKKGICGVKKLYYSNAYQSMSHYAKEQLTSKIADIPGLYKIDARDAYKMLEPRAQKYAQVSVHKYVTNIVSELETIEFDVEEALYVRRIIDKLPKANAVPSYQEAATKMDLVMVHAALFGHDHSKTKLALKNVVSDGMNYVPLAMPVKDLIEIVAAII
jgi:hypothetical protein